MLCHLGHRCGTEADPALRKQERDTTGDRSECAGASVEGFRTREALQCLGKVERAAGFSTRVKASLAAEPEAGGQGCIGKASADKHLLTMALV